MRLCVEIRDHGFRFVDMTGLFSKIFPRSPVMVPPFCLRWFFHKTPYTFVFDQGRLTSYNLLTLIVLNYFPKNVKEINRRSNPFTAQNLSRSNRLFQIRIKFALRSVTACAWYTSEAHSQSPTVPKKIVVA